jgi:hypothetical protein
MEIIQRYCSSNFWSFHKEKSGVSSKQCITSLGSQTSRWTLIWLCNISMCTSGYGHNSMKLNSMRTSKATSWKLTTNWEYFSSRHIMLNFSGPPKVKKKRRFLAIPNKLWTTYRLEKRGWHNCGLYRPILPLPVYQEALWDLSRISLGSHLFGPMSVRRTFHSKLGGRACHIRVFNNKSMPPTILLELIKSEAKLWVSARAKLLPPVILGE